MMPTNMEFGLNFKIYTYPYFFQIDQKQQKTSQNFEVSAVLSANFETLAIFFQKLMKFLQFFPKTSKVLQFFSEK